MYSAARFELHCVDTQESRVREVDSFLNIFSLFALHTKSAVDKHGKIAVPVERAYPHRANYRERLISFVGVFSVSALT